jgi:HSP20 family protein
MSRETGLAKQEPQSLLQSGERPTYAPACDIYENKDEILLVADLPGVMPDSLKINMENRELVLEAHRGVASSGTALGAEYRDCDFRRRFSVPTGIDGAKINADLKDGVLHLHLPKSDGIKPRAISVKAG